MEVYPEGAAGEAGEYDRGDPARSSCNAGPRGRQLVNAIPRITTRHAPNHAEGVSLGWSVPED